jgi:hypothetical protein
MGLKTKKAANSKKKNRAPEAIQPDDAQVTRPSPTHEEIQRRAYAIYLSQGAADGRDLDDWLQAERELSQANGGTTFATA